MMKETLSLTNSDMFFDILGMNKEDKGINVTLVSGSNGVYIPQILTNLIFRDNALPIKEVSTDDLKICSQGPETEYYWEAYDSMLNCDIIDDNGKEYFFNIDDNYGDLCLVDRDWIEENIEDY